MTTATATSGHLAGLIKPPRSTARSDSAGRLEVLHEEIRRHLLDSFTVRRGTETALDELDAVRSEASREGWNGYGAKVMHPEAYRNARLFLEALPTVAPTPEVSADPDGDVALDWVFGDRKALTLSISATGRCSFAWMRGQRTFRGTDWLDDGIPASIAHALSQLGRDSAARLYVHPSDIR